MKKFRSAYIFIVTALILSAAGALSGDETISSALLYSEMKKNPAIQRDIYLSSAINKTVTFSGTALKAELNNRYKRSRRIILKDESAASQKLDITYYIYIESESVYNQFIIGHQYKCTALIMAYTPLKTSRDSYIIDVILNQATNVIE
jgi:hypothetical protein